MRDIIGILLNFCLFLLVARAILSWFPVRSGTLLGSISAIVHDLTEPVLGPVRRVIPPAGMFDLSLMVVFMAVILLQRMVAAG
jgi:YggT family protein